MNAAYFRLFIYNKKTILKEMKKKLKKKTKPFPFDSLSIFYFLITCFILKISSNSKNEQEVTKRIN